MLFNKKEINDHRHPRLKKAFYLHRKYLRDYVINFARKIEENAMVLDFGCGVKPYLPFFKNVRYLGLDGHLKSSADILSYELLPIRSNSCDYVLSFQVLEHVSDPKTLIDEFNRILKPKGTLLISVPFLYEYHACPHDYWRFTHEGLFKLLENYSDIEIREDTSTAQTLLALWASWIGHVTQEKGVKWIGNFLIFLLNVFGLCLKKSPFKYETGYLTSNFIITARKKKE